MCLASNYIEIMDKSDKIISLISRINDKANSLIVSELKKNGITQLAPSHGSTLFALYSSKEKLRMNDISNIINKDKSTVTALINKLSKFGLVEREKCTVDSRITYIVLTKKGLDLKPIFIEVSNTLLGVTFAGFTQEEKENLTTNLEVVLDNF